MASHAEAEYVTATNATAHESTRTQVVLRRIMASALQPLWRLMVRTIPDSDPWERLDVAPRLNMYGSGARLEFAKYLSGKSDVAVASIGEIQDWLLGCRYEKDEVLFAEPDFWQHPATFERLRAGDCEDFAVWAWRKLVELDVDADLVVGYCLKDGQLDGRHAWVVFRRDELEYLFEPVCRDKDGMIRPLSEVRDKYLPEFGVDRTCRRFGFVGFLIAQKRLLDARATP
jgi:hypothetical protein